MTTATTAPAVIVCLLYLRVSTEEQAKTGYSLPEQRELCLKKARELAGSTPLETIIIEDTGGGDILERPALEKARAFLREHKPQYFICLDPDRFSRELFLQLLVTREIEAVGAELVFVQHKYEKTPEGKLFYSLRGAIAEFEKAKILDRTKRGLQTKLKSGKVANGTNPYGYTYNTETDTIDVIPEEAIWVKRIFEWAKTGLLPYQICDQLNGMGIPPKRNGKWRSATVQGMLRNTTYAGSMRCLRWNTAGYKAQRQLPKHLRKVTPKQRDKKDWVTVPVVHIISQALFDEVQMNLKTHKKRARDGAGILSGLLRCGLCGAAVHYAGDRQMIYMLRCHHRFPRRDALNRPEPCKLPNVKAAFIEDGVWNELTSWLLDPEVIAESIKQRLESSRNPDAIEQLQAEASAMRSQLTAKRKEQAATVGLVAKGLLDREGGEPLLADLQRQIDGLLIHLDDTERRLLSRRTMTNEADRFHQQLVELRKAIGEDRRVFAQKLTKLDMRRKQELVRRLISEVRVFPGRAYEVKERIPAFES